VDGVTQPRQQRSRESFARVRSATLALLAEKGPAGVTIADVSERRCPGGSGRVSFVRVPRQDRSQRRSRA